MPTYEYQCTKCARTFELFQSITAKPVKHIETDCTQCSDSAPVQRLIGSGAGVLFKGSGFYETDYRSESYKSGAKAEKESGEGKKSDDSSKPDGASKPDAGKTSGDKASTPAAPTSSDKTTDKPKGKKSKPENS